jgi:hypothetical protein
MKKLKLGEMVDVPPDHCPACNYAIDAASCVGQNASPSPGDVTICARCCSWLLFDRELHLQRVPTEMLPEIRTDPRCRLTERVCLRIRAERN